MAAVFRVFEIERGALAGHFMRKTIHANKGVVGGAYQQCGNFYTGYIWLGTRFGVIIMHILKAKHGCSVNRIELKKIVDGIKMAEV